MMNYLKRRFSSGDLQGELDDNEPEQENKLISTITKRIENTNLNMNFINNSNTNANSNSSNISNIISNFANVTRKASTKGPSPSAPASPTKNTSFADSVLNAARVMMNNNNNNSQSQSTANNSGINYSSSGSKFLVNKEKVKILLVIDDDHTDWSKYFKNRRLNGEFEIRVEQAEFKDMNLAAYTDTGVMVDLNIIRNGIRVVRSFKPDFVLIRQNVRDAGVDWKNIIIGLQYGNVPSINSLHSTYNFIDRAWVFSELVKINRRLGNDAFPLINQAYYPNHKEMLTSSIFPCVIKIGNAHQGLGKVRVQTPYEFQDLSSVVAISDCYSTTEPFIECKCDIQIQKIGKQYKAFIRKSITNQWKANTGSAMLEQIQMNDRYLKWIEEVEKMFGGLDICAVKGVIDNNSKEYITQVNDSAFSFLGESQEEDRKLIAELIVEKMTQHIKPQSINNEAFKSNVTQAYKDQNQVLNNDFMQQNIPSVNSSSQSSFSTIPNSRQLPIVPNRQTASPTRLNSQQIPPESSQLKNLQQNNSTINTINNSQNNNKAIGLTSPSSSSSSIASIQSIQSSSSISKPTSRPPVNLPGPISGQTTTSQGRMTPPTQQVPLSSQQPPLQTRQTQQQTPSRPQSQPHQQKMSVPQNISRPNPQNPLQKPNNTQNSDDGDDTMKNLRKTFAGIFGDM